MFTDLVNSTNTMTQLGDTEAVHRLRVHNAITRKAIRQHKGTEVKHTGDGFMVSFAGISDSAQCAISIQQGFKKYNLENPQAAMLLRIGLSAGEPIEQGADLFGTSVNMAARICNRAGPNQILVANVVRELCLGKSITFQDRDEMIFKGFEHPIRVYEVIW
jgi:class 3 adenylate cyclase